MFSGLLVGVLLLYRLVYPTSSFPSLDLDPPWIFGGFRYRCYGLLCGQAIAERGVDALIQPSGTAGIDKASHHEA
jgi:hypothetical protein